MAREVSALTGSPLKPDFAPVAVAHPDAKLPVRIEAADLCGRFSGRIVRRRQHQGADARLDGRPPGPLRPAFGVAAGRHLELRDVRAGSPQHIFDLDKIHDGLVVRWATAGRNAEAAERQHHRSSTRQVGVIADSKEVESLAGIMGGDATAVSDDTTRTSTSRPPSGGPRRCWPFAPLQLLDRRRPPLRARCGPGADSRAHRAHHAIDLEICGGEAGPMDDQTTQLPVRQAGDAARGPCRQDHRHAGDARAMRGGVFTRLGLEFVDRGEGSLTVTPPSWRFDMA